MNNALITVTDLEAGNGVVHVIDAVLLPHLHLLSEQWWTSSLTAQTTKPSKRQSLLC